MMRWALSGIVLFCAAIIVIGQDTVNSLPQDWTHRHVVFPVPDSEERRLEIERDPRYRHQQLRRTYRQYDLESANVNTAEGPPRWGNARGISPTGQMERDWREAVGPSTYTLSRPTYPAKFSFNASNPTPSCANDFIVYTLPVSSTADFNIVAYYNLYTNTAATGLCTGTNPTALFTYNASQNGGALSTAPVLSLDGTQIAFIENASSAQFHVLKWKSGNLGTTFPKPFNSAVLANCKTNGAVAPCEYSVTYATTTASLSSPFIDYTGDTAYVTDDKGHVSAIHPVFTATPSTPPAVVTGYPLAPSTGVMTAPVYDSVSGNVFAADTTKLYYIRTKSASTGTCTSGSPPCIGSTSQTFSTGTGAATIQEAPIVDSTNGWVFVFANSGPSYSGATIFQSDTKLTSTVKNVANISGTTGGSTATTQFSGTFDNKYYTSPATGKLYACGENNSGEIGTLWAAGFTSGGMKTGTATYGPLALMTATTTGTTSVCSSLNEVYNQTAAKDLLFVGVTTKCAFGASATGCLFAFDITSAFPTTALANYPTPNGTSGIVIDNVTGSLTSSTNLYFLSPKPLGSSAPCTLYTTSGTNTTGNCAVKLTQTLLN